MKRFILLLFSLLSLVANAQVLNSKFDTKNHPKAKGVWATIRYPTGWEIEEGERPNVVKKFSGNYNNLYVVLSLHILDVGSPVEKECNEMQIPEFTESISTNGANQVATNVKKIRHESKPAFIYEMQGKYERAGNSFQMSSKGMTVCYKQTMISAWCSPSKIDRANQTISSNQQQLNLVNSLCLQYFNSLILMDKY